MKLTQHTDYGLRVLLFVAAQPEERCQTRRMAEFFGVSQHHLTKVIQCLAAAGYVQTMRGAGGGVTLARDPATVSVGEVVRTLEPSFDLVECFEETGDCPISKACRLTSVLDEAQGAFESVLDGYTLADLIAPRSALARQLRAV